MTWVEKLIKPKVSTVSEELEAMVNKMIGRTDKKQKKITTR